MNSIFKNTFNVLFAVCTLALTTSNNIVQTNGIEKEYLQQLNILCKPGYKLSHDSDNSATSRTLNCLETGDFEAPPICVKKGKNIRILIVIRKWQFICLNICPVLTGLL